MLNSFSHQRSLCVFIIHGQAIDLINNLEGRQEIISKRFRIKRIGF